MDLLANDLSIHEQFHGLGEFQNALSRFMIMRNEAKRLGRNVYCHRLFLNTTPIPNMPLQQAIGNLKGDGKRAVMNWLTKTGPFWDEAERHGGGDWIECQGDIVTDTAIGEAAYKSIHGVDCGLVSLAPSEWCDTPINTIWRRESEGQENLTATLENCWSVESLKQTLRQKQPPINTWKDLRKKAVNRFARLTFSKECFEPLTGVPFAVGASKGFLKLLCNLNRFAQAFEPDGSRSAEGHRLYQNHFTGDRALFTDSSDSEKNEFGKELTFAHPEESGHSLFCPWHGKVSHQTLRLHFSWPIKAGEPAYVVYAGPKITKR